MIAIGLLLLILAAAVSNIWGTPTGMTVRLNWADHVGALALIVGLLLLVCGLFVWLWRTFP